MAKQVRGNNGGTPLRAMKATSFEFRFRVVILGLIYFIGFWAPWTRYGDAAPASTAWLALSALLAHHGIPLEKSTVLVTVAAIVCAFAGAALRWWGSAYLGPSVVQSSAMHAGRVMASGPYRFVRNPLYWGSWIFSLGVSILMPPGGAVFFLAANAFFYLRLILGEEAYLAGTLGAPYREYLQRVPRLVPRWTADAGDARQHAAWGLGAIGEIFPLGFAVCLAVLAWRYEPRVLIRSLLICFGASLVTRAFLPHKSLPASEA